MRPAWGADMRPAWGRVRGRKADGAGPAWNWGKRGAGQDPYPLVGELGGQASNVEDMPLDDADALESTATGWVNVLLALALAALTGRLLPRRDPGKYVPIMGGWRAR